MSIALIYVQVDNDALIAHILGEQRILEGFPQIARNECDGENNDDDDNDAKIKIPDSVEMS